LGCQEEGEGSKRRGRTGVRGGPVEGEREEGGKTTVTLPVHALKLSCKNSVLRVKLTGMIAVVMIQRLLFPLSLRRVILLLFRLFKNEVFSTNSVIGVSDIFFLTIWFISGFFLHLFLRALALTLDTLWHLWCRGFEPATDLDNN